MSLELHPHRTVLAVSGPDARRFLNGLVSVDVLSLTPERPRWAGLLSPQGKTLFDFLLFAHEEEVWIEAQESQSNALMQHLNRYRLRAQVTLTLRPDLGVFIGASALPDPRSNALPGRIIAPRTPDAPLLDLPTYTLHRWTHGVFEGAEELLVDKILWLETNARELGGVDFTKGCYVGQENTARMHHRDKIRRRLIAFTGESVVTEAKILQAGKEVGVIHHHHPGIGIAHIRMESLENPAPFTLNDQPVSAVKADYLAAVLGA